MVDGIWTLPALKEHFEKLRECDQEAVKVLASEFKTRMAGTNEWRGALEDQSKGKATTQQFDQLKEQVDEIKEQLLAIRNRTAGIGHLAGMIGGGITIIGVIVGAAYTIIQGAQ